MKYKRRPEKLGFPRSSFPFELKGHEIHLLHNDAYIKADDRIQIHLTLHCPRCDEEHTVRGRLPPEVEDYNYRAAVAKFLVLGHFNYDCSGRKHHTYYGS